MYSVLNKALLPYHVSVALKMITVFFPTYPHPSTVILMMKEGHMNMDIVDVCS